MTIQGHFINNIPTLSLLFIFIFFTPALLASDNFGYTPRTDLHTLPKSQQEFVKDIVTAYRNSDWALAKTRLHSSVIANEKCATQVKTLFMKKSIPEEYDVKIKPGKDKDSLYVKIRHGVPGKPNKTKVKMMRKVVQENGKLVIKMNCNI